MINWQIYQETDNNECYYRKYYPEICDYKCHHVKNKKRDRQKGLIPFCEFENCPIKAENS
jgi:hypothetical protein